MSCVFVFSECSVNLLKLSLGVNNHTGMSVFLKQDTWPLDK